MALGWPRIRPADGSGDSPCYSTCQMVPEFVEQAWIASFVPFRGIAGVREAVGAGNPCHTM